MQRCELSSLRLCLFLGFWYFLRFLLQCIESRHSFGYLIPVGASLFILGLCFAVVLAFNDAVVCSARSVVTSQRAGLSLGFDC